MGDWTVPDEFCVQCGRPLSTSRWYTAAAPNATEACAANR